MFKHLTQPQRYYICLQIANNITQTNIAKSLGVHRSTVSNEIKRNRRNVGDYDSDYAHKHACLIRTHASSEKAFKLITKRMQEYICSKLELKWSPEQISGRMKIDMGKTISHETIYSYIRHDKSTGGALFKMLPHKGKKYKYGSGKRVTIVDRIDISERPKIVETKTRIGDFEVDTIVSAKHTGKSCLFTMVDRRSKATFIRKTKDKSAASIQAAIEDIYLNTTLPIKTITSDNGTEFANHKVISESLACEFYFARPYKSCDRGLNEHTNGQIRKYVPKGTNLDTISIEYVAKIENDLNNRPRKALNYRTPNEVISKYLQRVSHNQLLRKNSSVAFHP
jgi:transposase, IS30 family